MDNLKSDLSGVMVVVDGVSSKVQSLMPLYVSLSAMTDSSERKTASLWRQHIIKKVATSRRACIVLLMVFHLSITFKWAFWNTSHLGLDFCRRFLVHFLKRLCVIMIMISLSLNCLVSVLSSMNQKCSLCNVLNMDCTNNSQSTTFNPQ